MASEAGEKPFDALRWTRGVQDRISQQIADMSGEELREWFSLRPTDPLLARLFDRRTVPEGRGRRSGRERERWAGASPTRRP